MRRFSNSPFEGQLDVVATLADDAYTATLSEIRKRDDLTRALRAALKEGVDISALSEACNLPPEEIRRRCNTPLTFDEDVEELAGLR